MKKALCALLAAGSLVGCGAPQIAQYSSQQTTFRTDGVSTQQVLVKLKTRTRDVNGFASRHQTSIKKNFSQINVMAVSVPANKTPEQVVAELKKDSTVAYAELDRRVKADEVTVNDTYRGKQYALDKVLAPKAWDITMGEEVKIAIVDSGVDLTHPDLAEKLVQGVNTVDKRFPPKDEMGHGTHVAGIAAAIANNNEGIAGLAPKATIIPVKVLGENAGSDATIAEGIMWAADQGADVINMSLGIYEESQVLNDAVKYAIDKNVVVVATMGNDNVERKRYPAACAGVIAVGSTDNQDKKSRFSNYGDWISIAAPGSDIFSTFPTYPVSINGPEGYASLSGTSMAAPLVTGLAALIRSKHKGMSPAEVKELIQKTADDLGDTGFDKMFGHGRVNALKALQ